MVQMLSQTVTIRVKVISITELLFPGRFGALTALKFRLRIKVGWITKRCQRTKGVLHVKVPSDGPIFG